MTVPCPLLIGVLHVSDRFSRPAVRELRRRMALFANQEGFGLLDVLEVHGSALRDATTYDDLVELGTRTQIAAVSSTAGWTASGSNTRPAGSAPGCWSFRPRNTGRDAWSSRR